MLMLTVMPKVILTGSWENQLEIRFLVENLKPRPKRSQHANAAYPNIVGHNTMRAFDHPVATCWGVVGSSLKMAKFEPTAPNISQQGGQTHATCCAQQCCDTLRWHVAIVWPGLYSVNLNIVILDQSGESTCS